jgi:cobalamin biosynthesis protein CobT
MVHPLGFMRDATKVIEQISARSDMELIAVGSNGIRLYRLRH